MSDLKPGNPLRVKCRTCGAYPFTECDGDSLDENGRRFHKKRSKDAFRDWRENSTSEKAAVIRGEPRRLPRRRKRHASMPLVIDKPENERAISHASRSAKDMQTPEFWASVWSEA